MYLAPQLKNGNFLCHKDLLTKIKLVENKKCCVCFLFCLVIQRNCLLNSKITKDLTVNLLLSAKEIVFKSIKQNNMAIVIT